MLGTRGLRGLLSAVCACAALAGLPAAAVADCGGVETAQPKRHVHAGRAPLAVGDSTMLLALPYLASEGFEVNAHGCRQFAEGLALLDARRRAGTLPQVVVVALGADYTVTPDDVRQALRILGRRRLLVLVTPRELGGGSGSDATVVRDAGRRYPSRVRVLDWVAHSRAHGEWFQPDGLHLTFSGARAFARFLTPALHMGPRLTPVVLPKATPGRPFTLTVRGLPRAARLHVALREPGSPHAAMLLFDAGGRVLTWRTGRHGSATLRFTWPALFAPNLCGSGTRCSGAVPWNVRKPAVLHACAPHGGPCVVRRVNVT